MKIKALSLAIILIMQVPSFACELTTGYDNAKPFHYLNEDNVVVGTDADILREAMRIAECKISFLELPWIRTLQQVENGSVDIAIGAKATKERALFAHYSAPYKSIEHNLYTAKGKHGEVQSIEAFLDNNDRTLGVVIGWGYPPEIAQAINAISNVHKVSKFEQLPKMLELGRIDGMIATPKTLTQLYNPKEISNKFAVRARYQEKLHFLFSKKSVNKSFVDTFNKGLILLANNGRVDQTMESHK
jgi:polar amino acid transport system substrate-binding protein